MFLNLHLKKRRMEKNPFKTRWSVDVISCSWQRAVFRTVSMRYSNNTENKKSFSRGKRVLNLKFSVLNLMLIWGVIFRFLYCKKAAITCREFNKKKFLKKKNFLVLLFSLVSLSLFTIEVCK